AHVRVARDPLNAVDGVQIALGPFLVKGQERGRFEGEHGKGRHERIAQGNLGIVKTVSGQAGKTAVHQAKQCIGGQMLTYLWRNDGHGKPRHENLKSLNLKSFTLGVFSHRGLRKASSSDTVITGLGGSAGIAGATGKAHAVPFIPFKINTAVPKGNTIWS